MFSIASMRAAIGTEFKAASTGIETEIHKFLDFVEGKQAKLAAAEKLLLDEGYKVIAPIEAVAALADAVEKAIEPAPAAAPAAA